MTEMGWLLISFSVALIVVILFHGYTRR